MIPDPLDDAGLVRFEFDTIDSTNAAAARWIAEYPDETRPALFTAATQTAGRGQWGRTWQSPIGGAWFSLALRRRRTDDLVSLEAAKAVRTALAGWVDDERFTIKPPNDVLLDQRKVAGILCEQSVRGEPDPSPSPAFTLVVGVGVNVNLDVASLGNGLRHPPIALRDATTESSEPTDIPIPEVIDACAAELLARLRNP